MITNSFKNEDLRSITEEVEAMSTMMDGFKVDLERIYDLKREMNELEMDMQK